MREAVKYTVLLLIVTAIATFDFAPPPAQSHLVTRPEGDSLKARAGSQKANLRHARYVASYGKGANRRWHRKAKRWLAAELRETRRQMYLRLAIVPWWPWGALANCESSGVWHYNGPSGFDGGLQFHPGTWASYRQGSEPAFAYQAPAAVQVDVAERVLGVQGWGAWPHCSSELGLR